MKSLTCQLLDLSIADVEVVHNLQLEFEPGSFWAVLGSNGAGKTTLLNCLAGLKPADRGRVMLGDEDVHRGSRRKLAIQMGMLQQHSSYVFDSTVFETILTGRHPHLKRWENESPVDFRIARHALEQVDLAGFENRCVTSLSGGEARRLAFATLLVQQVNVLLLDEPSNHLDLRHQLQVMEMIHEQSEKEGKTAIAALHDINLAMSFCSNVLMLFGGGEWAAGPVGEMMTEERLERIYGCPIARFESAQGPRFYPQARGR